MTHDEVVALAKQLTQMGQHYQVLQNQVFSAGKTRCKGTTKLHYVVAHVATQAGLVNQEQPRGHSSVLPRACRWLAKQRRHKFL